MNCTTGNGSGNPIIHPCLIQKDSKFLGPHPHRIHAVVFSGSASRDKLEYAPSPAWQSFIRAIQEYMVDNEAELKFDAKILFMDLHTYIQPQPHRSLVT